MSDGRNAITRTAGLFEALSEWFDGFVGSDEETTAKGGSDEGNERTVTSRSYLLEVRLRLASLGQREVPEVRVMSGLLQVGPKVRTCPFRDLRPGEWRMRISLT